MKKLFSAFSAMLLSLMFSVTAFASVNPATGGEGGIFVIIAIVAAVLAVAGGIFFFVTGSKK